MNKITVCMRPRGAPSTRKLRGAPALSYDGGWLLDNSGNPKVVNWRNQSQSITYDLPGKVLAATFDTDGSVLVVTNDAPPVPSLAPGDEPAGSSGTYTGWDCAPGGGCEQVVAPTKDEIRLVGWDT